MAEAIVIGLAGGGATGAAFAATTAGLLATTAVSVGLSLVTSWAVSALTPLPPSPKQSILVNSRGAAEPQEIVYGRTRKGGTTTYYETTRKGSVLYQIITIADHEVDAFEAIYVNDKEVTLSADGYDNGSRQGAGWVTDEEWTSDGSEHEIRIFYHKGDQTAITDTFANSSTETLDSVFFDTGETDEDSQNFGGSGQPTKASFVGNGKAYIFVRYGFNAGVFSKGLPLITAKVRGKKVFDPRTSTTVWSDNAALCIRDFLTSANGLSDPSVDDTIFQVAANICDENVTLDAGGTEKRYTINGVVRADQSYGDVLTSMTTACAGTLFWGAGKWKLTVGAYSAPTKTLTLGDLRSNISLQTRTNLRDQFNRVQGVFTDGANRYIPADYPAIESAAFLAQDDGVEQSLDLDLPFTTSAPTAQRLAKMTLFRGREQMVFSADFGLNAFDVEVGEIIALTIDRYGWDAKEFEVVGWNFNSNQEAGDLRVSLVLRETSEAAFDWNAEEVDIIANDSTLNLTLDPVANLTAQYDGTVSKDGTFLNGIVVDWDSVVGADGYDVEWTVNTSIDFAANGGIVEEADAVTAREIFIYKAYVEILYRQPDQDGFDFYNTGGGSGLTETELRAQLAASPEKATLKFSGIQVRNPTTEYTIKPVLDNTIYNIRVRAFNRNGTVSLWKSVSFDSTEDDTIPSAPTGLTATGGTGAIKLSWNPVTTNTDASTANDIFLYAIYRGTSTGPTTLIDTTAGVGWSDVSLAAGTTYYYRIKAVDFSGNESDYSNEDSANTTANGSLGKSTYTGRVYFQTLQGSAPATPSATSFTPATGLFTGLTSGWAVTQPSVSITDTTVQEWSSVYTVQIDNTSGTQTITFATPVGAIQVAADIQSDNYVAGTSGWNIERDTGNAEFNDVTVRGDIRMTDPNSEIDLTTNPIPGVLVGIQMQSGSSDEIVKTYQNSISQYVLSAYNYSGSALDIQSNIVSGSGDGIRVRNFGGSGSTAIDASTNSGGAAQIALSSADGGFGVFVPSTSNNGILSQRNDNTAGKEAGRFQNTNLGGDAILGLPAVSGGWGIYVPSGSANGIYSAQPVMIETSFGITLVATSTNNGLLGDVAWLIHGNGGNIKLATATVNGGYAFDAPAGDGRLQAGTYTPFTGSHDALLLKGTTIEEGDILCDREVVFRSVSDSITKVSLSVSANDPSCIGVFKRKFASVDLPLLDDDSLYNGFDHIQVNSVGEGGVNVCGENGDIKAGDLIVTSSTPGKGMKQSDDIVRSYTVAKAREDVTFSSSTEVKMVACIYLCG